MVPEKYRQGVVVGVVTVKYIRSVEPTVTTIEANNMTHSNHSDDFVNLE